MQCFNSSEKSSLLINTNCNTILPILQTLLTNEEVDHIVQAIGYVDKARKFTVHHEVTDSAGNLKDFFFIIEA